MVKRFLKSVGSAFVFITGLHLVVSGYPTLGAICACIGVDLMIDHRP